MPGDCATGSDPVMMGLPERRHASRYNSCFRTAPRRPSRESRNPGFVPAIPNENSWLHPA